LASTTRYAYDAPDLQFRAELDVDEDGVVQNYGVLWRLVSGRRS